MQTARRRRTSLHRADSSITPEAISPTADAAITIPATPAATVAGAITPLLLSPADAAKALGLSRATVYNLLAAQAIQSFSVGKRRVIPVTALHAYIARELAAAGE